MKTMYYKMLFILLLLPGITVAGNDFNGRFTKSKKINKSYNVSPNALLEIENRYGKIDITTWDQDRVEIEVTIKTNGNNEEAVIKRLQEIDVAFSGTNSHVKAETLLERGNSASWWKALFGDDTNVNIEINYSIKAPVTNNMDLTNDYGSISLDKLEGNAKINCDYGRLIIGKLLGDENYLNFDYTRSSEIAYMKRGKISADYSEFTLVEAGTVELEADYSDTHIQKVENIDFNCDYGSITLDKVRRVKGRADYLITKLGAVYQIAELSLDYGSFSIEQLMANAKKVTIESDYTSIKIGYSPDTPFSFEISTSYGDVNGIEAEDFEILKHHQESGDDYLQGYHITAEIGPEITIDSEYGNITFED